MFNTKRISDAFALAAQVHADQKRKGTNIAYISHPMAVASQVAVWGGDENQLIAALLHDVVEDGGIHYRDVIQHRFGQVVADIVMGCSDAAPQAGEAKGDWKTRKTAYIRHLETASSAELLVSAADKWHNLLSILSDVRQIGNAVYERFISPETDLEKKRTLTLWYYQSLIDIYRKRGLKAAGDLQRLLDEITRESERRRP